jgi:hypothetical protein
VPEAVTAAAQELAALTAGDEAASEEVTKAAEKLKLEIEGSGAEVPPEVRGPWGVVL